MEVVEVLENVEEEVLNCTKMKLEMNLSQFTVCMQHPEEMLKPWKNNPVFFEIVVAHAIIFIFGVIGNIIVIIVMAGDSKSRSATNSFLVSLAVGDLLMLCVYGPLETYTHFVIQWDENGVVCKTAQLAELVSATSSVLNLLAVTVERFVVIVFPMKSRTLCTVSNMFKAVLGVWLLSFLLASPVVFTTGTYKILFTNNITNLTLNYCNSSIDSPVFVLYQFFVIFFIPSLTMTVCYSFVIRELWASTRKMSMLTNGMSFRNKASKTPILALKKKPTKSRCDSDYSMVDVRLEYPVHRHINYNKSISTSKNLKKSFRNSHEDCTKPTQPMGHYITTNKDEANAARKQVIKMLILVVVLFFVCWGPRVTMDVLQKFHLITFNQTMYTMRMIFNIMTFFHGCINPFIYSFMSKNFRNRFIRYLEKCGCKKSSDWPASMRLMQNSASQKSQPGPSISRNDITGKCVCTVGIKKFNHGSYISDTKNTEVDSVLYPPRSSSYPSNVTVCICAHQQDAC